jgi:hypothetical protein
MVIDRVADLAGLIELVGRVGDTVVRISGSPAAARSREGDRVIIHAARFSELD